MEQTTTTTTTKLAAPPRPRRKLQKSITKQKNFISRRLGLDTSNEFPVDTKLDTSTHKNTTTTTTTTTTTPRLVVPPPVAPDLSDPKWSEYIRDSGSLYALGDSSSAKKQQPEIESIIPELSHLALHDPTPTPTTPRSATPPSTTTTNMRRRRAKTPIFSIYQLDSEEIPRPGNALASAEKRLSAEVIAEQYRALLESRNSMARETYSSSSDDEEVHLNRRLQHTPDSTTHSLRSPTSPSYPSSDNNTSPKSEASTLVAFDEETVYFKPISFSPEPISPLFDRRHFLNLSPSRSPTPPIPSANLGLQICLDLLTRDLSSSLRRSSETSALQVWAMIEAYERLRDQLQDQDTTRLSREEVKALEGVFGMWIKALYAVHASLVGGDGAGVSGSESDYGGEDLN
ncbi:hypothetical protein B0T19DRAFT_136936 [Cercophora scortea]|uniref:Mating-type switching protein swi10 n=1 Tax=Cercophora scortea TaxID=314031 RepID=A0AAE0IZI7_9PEZI|nr:hypothetical protein B0T19DRAFT_136936 [Cercophora scortea]